MIKSIIFSLIVAVNVHAATIQWDHDCSNADGFYVYYSDTELENPHSIITVACPSVQASVHLPGRYSVTAYNEYGESEQSNNIEIAQYYYNAIKIDYDASGRVLYRGEHTDYDAATSDENWVIKRYFYDTTGRLIDIKIRVTSWDNRATGW